MKGKTRIESRAEDEVVLNDDEDEPVTREELERTIETYFENAKFANNAKFIKANRHNHTGTKKGNKYKALLNTQAAHTIGCFNCGRHGCYVATCKKPRDASRIAQNITRWKELRKMEKSSRININNIPKRVAILMKQMRSW